MVHLLATKTPGSDLLDIRIVSSLSIPVLDGALNDGNGKS